MLNHYLGLWQLSHPQLVTETATSHIYKVWHEGETTILKLLKPVGIKDEKGGAVALRHFDGNGAIRLIHADEGAHLLEYADGDDLVGLVRDGHDMQATTIIAEVLNRLHTIPHPTDVNGLTPLKIWFRALFDKAHADKAHGDHSIYVRSADVAQTLLANPRDVRVLHGDIHHENIRHHKKRGWLAFDPKGLIGERTYDLANTLCNPISMNDVVLNERRFLKNTTLLSEKLEIDQPRIIAFVYSYACLSASWSLEDAMDASLALGVAHIAERHLDKMT